MAAAVVAASRPPTSAHVGSVSLKRITTGLGITVLILPGGPFSDGLDSHSSVPMGETLSLPEALG